VISQCILFLRCEFDEDFSVYNGSKITRAAAQLYPEGCTKLLGA
jgi:hypothetical protein